VCRKKRHPIRKEPEIIIIGDLIAVNFFNRQNPVKNEAIKSKINISKTIPLVNETCINKYINIISESTEK